MNDQSSNQNNDPEVHVFVIDGPTLARIAEAARLIKSPNQRRQMDAEATILNRFLHDEQARLGWGSRFLMWGSDGPKWDPDNLMPLFGKALEEDHTPLLCERLGLPTDRVVAVAQAKIDRHFLPSGTFSKVRTDGMPHECHATYAWPLDDTVWEEAALRGFDYDQMPDWVKNHIQVAVIAARAHWRRVAPLIEAAWAEANQ